MSVLGVYSPRSSTASRAMSVRRPGANSIEGTTMKRLLAAAAVLSITGCVHTQMIELTAPEREGLRAAMAQPLTFTVPKEQAGDAWGRAQSFVGRFSSMKLQTASEFVIQTFNPVGSSVAYGYYVTRTPLGAEHQFEVQCVFGNMFSAEDANANAHLAAHYISTGQLPCQRCIAR